MQQNIFTNDLLYPPQASLDPRSIDRILAELSQTNALGYQQFAAMVLQVKDGAQLWVSKDVSDDLQLSEIPVGDIHFDDVEWPHDRMEVYFEDSSIPTFLAARFTNEELVESLRKVINDPGAPSKPATNEPDPEIPFIHLQAEAKDGGHCSAAYKHYEIDSFVAGAELPEGNYTQLPSNERMGQDEESVFREMMLLLYKVLLFASAEGHTVRRTMDKPTRKQGGKAGFKGRPKQERMIVEYLPHHRTEKRRQANEEGKKHEFKGRRGHFRVYKSERYKTMKGKRQFIFPVPAPDGSMPRRRFVVRKP